MDSDPIHPVSEPDFSWISGYHEKVFPTSSKPPTTPKLPESMPDVNDFRQLLQTRKNGVEYTIFGRTEFKPGSAVSDSIITYGIGVLEQFDRMRKKKINLFPEGKSMLVSSHLATDGVHDLVQIVARKNERSKLDFLCWAEDAELVTGTAIVRMRCKKFPFKDPLVLYGDFEETMRARFLIMSECMKEQLALCWVDSIDKLAV